jgi:endonuclease YncB( thermonuclease family)
MRWGKVVKVYDGDTVHLAFLERGQIVRHPLRLLGYDCAEMRAKGTAERQLARRSKARLEELLQGRVLELLAPVRWDKYGRLLADARLPGVPSVCAWMLEHGEAVKYDGGTKTQWPA